ncbi:MAG: MATE family efflux transporter [Bacteroidales bacterium]|nr:MATE family efflux transporter [Bacteroidales bacterium]
MNREILRIAIPGIVTNITVPLLGIVDLSIVGHMSSSLLYASSDGGAAAIGAISVGGLIFNMVYWLFNFLRMGSSGLTAQAFGRQDGAGERKVLRMGLQVALVCGLCIFALQRPIEWMAHIIIAPTGQVWQLAIAYFRIRIWAAPAVLALFAMSGWFVGMQNARYPMFIAIGQNLLNIVLSVVLVFKAGMGVEGVALGTVLSQYAGLAAAIVLMRRTPFHASQSGSESLAADAQVGWSSFFTVNRDIFFRMVCLIAVTTAFTSFGARQGDLLLAVNTMLIQLFLLFSYFSDAFSLAGEALVGKYMGMEQTELARQASRPHEPLSARKQLRKCVHYLFLWAGGITLFFSLLYVSGAHQILKLFTDDLQVIAAAQPYLPWMFWVPLAGFAAFMWDGIFIGATATRQMMYTLLLSSLVFFLLWLLPLPLAPNHHLWFCFIAYLATRSLYQTWIARRIV